MWLRWHRDGDSRLVFAVKCLQLVDVQLTRGDVEETSHRAQSLLLRNLNKVPDRWFREAIWKELRDPCCQAKKCLLNSSCDYMGDVLRIMREAKL